MSTPPLDLDRRMSALAEGNDTTCLLVLGTGTALTLHPAPHPNRHITGNETATQPPPPRPSAVGLAGGEWVALLMVATVAIVAAVVVLAIFALTITTT